MPHIASTLTTDMKYTLWGSNPGGVNVETKHVIIHGGHGVAHRRSHGGLETPEGVMTQVTDEELEILEKDEVFQLHKKNGFVRVIKTAKAPAPEKAAADMAAADASAPLVDKDFQEGGRAAAPSDLKLSVSKDKKKGK